MTLNIPIKFALGTEVFVGIPKSGSVTKCEYSDKTVSTLVGSVNGLTIEAEITDYRDFNAREWVVYFKNNTDSDSELLSDVLSASIEFDEGDATLYTCNGDFCSNDGYETTAHPISCGSGFSFEQAPCGGRACDRAFPYQRLVFDNKGYNIAIGWPGQWFCRWEESNGKISFSAGQQDVHTVLHPGESFRTPRMAIVEFDGSLEKGINVWRRWYRKHVMRQNIIPLVHGLDNDSGLEFCDATEDQQLRRVSNFVENDIGINMWWIDAGWYPSTLPDGRQDWWKTTGTWECDKKRFPNGLKPIGEYCNQNGIKLLTWFEVERTNEGTKLFTEHPEWMLKNTDKPMKYGFMLDMSNDECVDYLSHYIADFLNENKISVYRQDYNFEPLSYWRYNEAPDRIGMCENRYICGYLAYWDYLLENVPDLIIDSCSSGGRRNDLETMRRAVIMHETDEAYGNHPVKHAFFQTLYSWLPYFRGFMESWEGDGGEYFKPDYYHQPRPLFDNYNLFSAFAPCMNLGGYGYIIEHSPESEETKAIKDAVAIWKKISGYLLDGDFYALTPYHKNREKWTVWQFDSPETADGIFEVIRNNAASDEELTVTTPVCGEMELENLVTGEKMTARGEVTFEQPIRSISVWKYCIKK